MAKKKYNRAGRKNAVLDKLVERVAEVKDLDKRVVEHIVRYSFKFIADEITSGRMNPILIHYFGTFSPKQYILDDKYSKEKKSSQKVEPKDKQKKTN